jgi:hypothetical protein
MATVVFIITMIIIVNEGAVRWRREVHNTQASKHQGKVSHPRLSVPTVCQRSACGVRHLLENL